MFAYTPTNYDLVHGNNECRGILRHEDHRRTKKSVSFAPFPPSLRPSLPSNEDIASFSVTSEDDWMQDSDFEVLEESFEIEMEVYIRTALLRDRT